MFYLPGIIIPNIKLRFIALFFILFLLIFLTTVPFTSYAQQPVHPVFPHQLRLPSIFSDNMVLQQDTIVMLRGWASPEREIKVIPSWNKDTFSTETLPIAEWSIPLKTPKAGGPYKITIIGDTTLVIHNVLIGQVWLCSGQSNMAMSASWHIKNYKEEIKNAHHPEIRLFRVEKATATSPQNEVHGSWKVCTPQSMESFSSAGYFFGLRLHKSLDQPVGLIQSAWGGTPVEVWMPYEIFRHHSKWLLSSSKKGPGPRWPTRPSIAFNAMINPLTNFCIKGVIWYQGESNTSNPYLYEQEFSQMIKSWRLYWGSVFPFYFVQIAPFNYSRPYCAALLREAQLNTYMHVPKTGIVITTDITDDTSVIHPKDKQDVGKRLAIWALAKTYGYKNMSYSGPLFHFMKIKDNKAIIHFYFADKGLARKGDHLRDFFIAGKNHHFISAKAKIVGQTVVVSSPLVDHPIAVRMGFSNTVSPNLFNNAGLPASPFRTDHWSISYVKK